MVQVIGRIGQDFIIALKQKKSNSNFIDKLKEMCCSIRLDASVICFCMILLFAILSLTGHVSTCVACFIIHYPWRRVISMYTKSSLSPWIINPISMLYIVHTCFLPNVINTMNSKNISHSSAFHCQTTGSNLRWKLFFSMQSLQLMNSKSLQNDVIDYQEKMLPILQHSICFVYIHVINVCTAWDISL